MSKGGILFLLLAAGYVGFEIYVVRSTAYRTEPLFIYDKFVAADLAAARCPGPDAEQRLRFARNLEFVTQRAARELAEENPELMHDGVSRMLAQRRATRAREIDAMIEGKGCEDKAVWELLKGFENRARLNLG